uniref:Uncharacterized protein n=1 Tax=Fibrocapsa japonica TaxID=94617 RepID=A0A7S2V4G2_9STRA
MTIITIALITWQLINSNGRNSTSGADFYNIYVIRHAEGKYQPIHKCDPPQHPKLNAEIGMCGDWGDNRCGGDYLIEPGLDRADCIANLNFEGMALLIAQNPLTCHHEGVVKREYQTVLPLSMKKGMPINIDYSRNDEVFLAQDLTLSSRRYELCSNSQTVQSVVISWDHSNIPTLLMELGCDHEMCHTKMKKYDFESIYKLTMSCIDGSFLYVEQSAQGCS